VPANGATAAPQPGHTARNPKNCNRRISGNGVATPLDEIPHCRKTSGGGRVGIYEKEAETTALSNTLGEKKKQQQIKN
jgi:hypothetical protein